MADKEAVPGPDQPRKVRFRQAHLPYNAGEIAGFVPAMAANLVERRIAEYWPPAELAPKDPPPAVDTRTHELTVDEVAALAEGITDPAEVATLIAGEKAHPKHPDGRKGALELLELRAAELTPPPA